MDAIGVILAAVAQMMAQLEPLWRGLPTGQWMVELNEGAAELGGQWCVL